jgi:hypothetical protein
MNASSSQERHQLAVHFRAVATGYYNPMRASVLHDR